MAVSLKPAGLSPTHSSVSLRHAVDRVFCRGQVQTKHGFGVAKPHAVMMIEFLVAQVTQRRGDLIDQLMATHAQQEIPLDVCEAMVEFDPKFKLPLNEMSIAMYDFLNEIVHKDACPILDRGGYTLEFNRFLKDFKTHADHLSLQVCFYEGEFTYREKPAPQPVVAQGAQAPARREPFCRDR